ncbi:butyrophilin-like protein 10 [Parambassis ranga]|uniref:Butyrophilin-like protein 10 n=1 Tax=Parambassis ranga TaxID=210632 RepID=A0A6P7KAW6_9TELE|nr:butyrophilin-like protein 10 [Parambassis ranga]
MISPEYLIICLFVLTVSSATTGHDNGPRVIVQEGSDATLSCSPSIKEDLTYKVFDWKKDGQKEVFFYDAGLYYGNGRSGQDEQFRGRVFHFPDQLTSGNASITIQNAKREDGGEYSCVFPRLHPAGQRCTVQLVVQRRNLTDRSRKNSYAAPKPFVGIINSTEDGVRLKCALHGAYPKPKVEWKNSDGRILPAEEPVFTDRGGRFDVTLLATVTKTATNHFTCVVTQEGYGHKTEEEVYVPDKLFESCREVGTTGSWTDVFTVGALVGALIVAVLGALIVVVLVATKIVFFKPCWNRKLEEIIQELRRERKLCVREPELHVVLFTCAACQDQKCLTCSSTFLKHPRNHSPLCSTKDPLRFSFDAVSCSRHINYHQPDGADRKSGTRTPEVL